MSSPDVERDALALIKASIEEDQEATEVILGHCDLRAVAEDLAFRAACLALINFRSQERALTWITAIQHDWAADEADK
jgi:hypothetical protein